MVEEGLEERIKSLEVGFIPEMVRVGLEKPDEEVPRRDGTGWVKKRDEEVLR